MGVFLVPCIVGTLRYGLPHARGGYFEFEADKLLIEIMHGQCKTKKQSQPTLQVPEITAADKRNRTANRLITNQPF